LDTEREEKKKLKRGWVPSRSSLRRTQGTYKEIGIIKKSMPNIRVLERNIWTALKSRVTMTKTCYAKMENSWKLRGVKRFKMRGGIRADFSPRADLCNQNRHLFENIVRRSRRPLEIELKKKDTSERHLDVSRDLAWGSGRS